MFSDHCRRPIAVVIRACASAAILLLTVPAPLAQARPSPNPATSGLSVANCPLTRVGTQFVRCDNLTGAGVPAPPWIPELASGKAIHKLDPVDHGSGQDVPPAGRALHDSRCRSCVARWRCERSRSSH